MNTRLLLARHGHATSGPDHRWTAEDPLTEIGQAQARELGAALAARSDRPDRATDADGWEEPSDMWEETPPNRRPRRPRSDSDRPEASATSSSSSSAPRQRRPRPSSTQDNSPPTAADYVDYQPIDETQARADGEDPSRRDKPNRPDRQDRPEEDAPQFDY